MKPILPLVLALVAVPAGAEKTVAIAPADIGEVKTLEVVVVTGSRSLSQARLAIVEAEDRFHSRWNELNADRRFDIRCHDETPRDHPSRIWKRICQPAFLEDMATTAAQEFTQGVQGAMTAGVGAVMLPSANPGGVLQLRTEMRRRTLDMLQKDPELMRALLERARLQQHFETLRKEKFKDRWIVAD